jgi:hypothetical protein
MATLYFSALAFAAAPVLGQVGEPKAGVVLGKEIHAADVEALRYYILRELTDRYAAQKGISVSRVEIERYQRQVDDAMRQDARMHSDTAAGQNIPQTPSSYTAEEQAARDQIATAFILQWKINQALYHQYGGRVIFQQGGPEPLDATRKFLEHAEARGEFTIADKALASDFWRYYRNDAMHSFYPPGKETKRVFASPPWERGAKR